MAQPANRLQEDLYKYTNKWCFPCAVCEKEMARGCKDHVLSHGHWNNLWIRLGNGDGIPEADVVAEWSKTWVQRFETPKGTYLFNHITGDQMLSGREANAQAPSTQTLHHSGPPTSDHSAETHGTTRAPADLVHPASDPGVSWRMPVRYGLDYVQALADEQSWRTYMIDPATRFENNLSANWAWRCAEPCFVCSTAMSGGVKSHLLSTSHWSQVRDRLKGPSDSKSKTPQLAEAIDWRKPWVEVIKVGSDDYLFNHLTGEQGLRSQVAPTEPRAICLPPGLEAASPAPTRAAPAPEAGITTPSPATVPVPSVATVSLPSAPAPPKSITTPEAQSDPSPLDVFFWQQLMDGPSRNLATALARYNQRFKDSEGFTCDVCSLTMSDVREHIRSADHYFSLRTRLGHRPPPSVDISSGPWVQKAFRMSSATIECTVPVSFNHITGEVITSEGRETQVEEC